MRSFLVISVIIACLQAQSLWAESRLNPPAVNGFDYSRPAPVEYSYRSGRIQERKDYMGDFFSSFQNFFSGGKKLGPLPAEQAVELKLKVRELTQQLLDRSEEPMGDQHRVVVTTFVNLNQLYRTSGFGRVMAEQMISEMQRAGIEVVDVRMTPSIQILEGYGEYGLSRDMSELSYVQSAQAIVVGTYTISNGQVMVNARLLQQANGLVLSSGSIALQMDDLICGFLQDEAMPPRRGAKVELRDFSEIARKEHQ
ncbi:MAG: FlgO family outer membrane protein [Pseudomonadota bacterium]